MNKIGFDNDKYLQMQSEKILERIEFLEVSCTWNSAESYLMITTLPEYFRVLNRTVR